MKNKKKIRNKNKKKIENLALFILQIHHKIRYGTISTFYLFLKSVDFDENLTLNKPERFTK